MQQVIRDQFDIRFRIAFAAFMLRDSLFLSHVAADVRHVQFLDETLNRIVQLILTFYEEHGSAPDTLIYTELDKLRESGMLSEEKHDAINVYLNELYANQLQNRDYLLSHFQDFVRYSRIEANLPRFVELSQAGDWESAESLLRDTFAVTRSDDLVAATYSADVLARISRRNIDEQFSITFIPELDPYVKVCRGHINVIQSRASSDGKTAFLCYLCRYYLYTKLNVLVVSLEETVDKYEDRMDQCLCNMTQEEISDIANVEKLKHGVSRYISRGSLKIKHMLPSQTKISDIDRLIESLIAADNFRPDVLLLDYADRCAPETNVLRGDVVRAQEEVYNTLDALTKKHNLFCWTAMQSNRAALKDEANAGQYHTGGALNKQQISRLVISVNRGDDLGANKAKLHIVKNSYGPKDISVDICQDYSRQQFRVDPARPQEWPLDG